MRLVASLGLLFVLYLATAIALNEYFWLSKSVPSVLAVLIAWFVYRQLSFTATATALVLVAIVLPLSVLIFGVSTTSSTTGNLTTLVKNLSLVDALATVAPVVIGMIVLAVLKALGSATPSSTST